MLFAIIKLLKESERFMLYRIYFWKKTNALCEFLYEMTVYALPKVPTFYNKTNALRYFEATVLFQVNSPTSGKMAMDSWKEVLL